MRPAYLLVRGEGGGGDGLLILRHAGPEVVVSAFHVLRGAGGGGGGLGHNDGWYVFVSR